MAKLYFKYGAMGSSKTAQALMCKFNYEQKGYTVKLLKPLIDNRDVLNNKNIVKSRIGLYADCISFSQNDNLIDVCGFLDKNHVVIVDECQFLTTLQVEQLKEISLSSPVLCYGLLTNFQTKLFEGSKRLVEIADSLMEIKSVCKCGRKAMINSRWQNGKLVTQGEEVLIGGDDTYEGICYTCYLKEIQKQKEEN